MRKSIILVAVGIIAGAGLAVGTMKAVQAGATNPAATYYGCVSAHGALSKVGTVSPTCPGKSTQISWNSIGPQGQAGPGAESGYSVGGPNGSTASVTLAVGSGSYIVTWDITVAPAAGGCSSSTGTNVMGVTSGDSSALVTVGGGGGSTTVRCTNNRGGVAIATATPTSIQ